ncbi:MAG: AraC family transcriptional regulator [Lachnospiraceae bacterium]|nr:AraC family transcriptional regulator [Lachnospiraceae bacterium]
MINVDVMPDASEIVHYDIPGVPLYVRKGQLSAYPDMRAICHWHEDLEFIYVTEGEMNYFIGGHTVLLCAGDSLFVNARQMHYGYANHQIECRFLCILVHPTILVQNELLYKEWMEPLLTDTSFPYFVYDSSCEEATMFAQSLLRAYELKEAAGWGSQIDILCQLVPLVMQTARRRLTTINQNTPDRPDAKLLAQQQMVAYIAAHFTEDVTLDEIAASASVSKSTCCRLFKTYIHQSPFEYLNTYRLEQSRYLLTDTNKGITEIAMLCGFNHISYYSRLFSKSYGCSPHAYRKEHRQMDG